MSYFDDYFNFEGEKTLRGYTALVDLSRFGKNKMMPLFPAAAAKSFAIHTPVEMRAGELWMREKGIYDQAKQ